jgi:uncharacterized Rossmann fold enzyme
MKHEIWNPLYERICRDFGFDPVADLECANTLARLLGNKSDESLMVVRKHVSSTVLVCGGGANLEEELSSIEMRWPIVAADSATSILLESGITPDIIVTDLDGVVEDQVEFNSRGVPVVMHAHGDNQQAIKRHVNRFGGAVVGTCQCSPPEHLFNFGGFTDGDRAACICSELGAKTILLTGFDFENPSMKPGKNRDVKKRKLRWARTILDELAAEGIRVIPVMSYREL